jgi:hypothetical protein
MIDTIICHILCEKCPTNDAFAFIIKEVNTYLQNVVQKHEQSNK